jgi:predicted dehydrogenase
MPNPPNRRDFVRSGLLITTSKIAFGSQANSALTLGLIGCGGRGMYVSGVFAKHEYLKVTGVCDIYDDKIAAATQKYSGAKAYKNYKDLLAGPYDAVYIATPAFLHPEHMEAAILARKHIFCEKPVGVDAAGCKRVIAAAKKADPTKRISVDFQQRYGKDYRKVFEIVKSGELGGIKMIRAAWIGGGPAIKSGHAASEERIRNWFFYRELSGDIVIEQDCHNIDVVNWFVGKHPVRVAGYGSRQVRHYGDIYDNIVLSYQFDDGRTFSYSANQFRAPGFSDVSETFMCEKGAANVSRRGYTIWREKGAPETGETKYDITIDAVNEFIDGARNGKIENFATDAAISTLTAYMGLRSAIEGREMTWSDVWNG